MAQALIAGLLGYGISSSRINVIYPSHSIKKKLKNFFKVTVTTDLEPRILSNKIIVLAVKPNKISEVCEKIQTSELNNTIIISFAAGAT